MVERQAFVKSAQAAWRGSSKNTGKTDDCKLAQAQWVVSLWLGFYCRTLD